MEKFSGWRDKGTGISPFLPVDSHVNSFKSYVLNPSILALKLPFLVALYVFSFVAPKAAFGLILKWLFSISDIDVLVEGVRKSNKAQIDASKPSKGEVAVSNLVSPLDLFVIFLISNVSSLSSIVAIIPYKNELYLFSVWQALALFFLPLENCVSEGTKLGNANDLSEKLVVVFAEGTPSNNKAVLPLQESCSKILSNFGKSAKVTVLRYYPGTVTLPIPHITKFQYISKLLTLPGKAYVKAKIVPLENVSLKACQNAFSENGLSRVELGFEDKAKFYKYFQESSTGL